MKYGRSRTSPRRRVGVTLLVILLVALAAGGYVSSRPRAASAFDLGLTGSVENGTVTGAVLSDGWSWASLRSTTPVVYDAGTSPTNGAALDFTPITATQVSWLSVHAPQVLVATAGRMLTTAKDVACSRAGCTSDGGSIPLSWFSDLASVPGWGPMYRAWGISAAIYVAPVSAALADQSLEVGAAGWGGYQFPLLVGGEVGAGANGTNGYGRDLFDVAAGLGRFFPPTPLWSSAHPVQFLLATTTTGAGAYPGNPAPNHAPLGRGLGSASALVGSLGVDEMTFLTSPTSGCGMAVCAPGAITSHTSGYRVHNYQVCDGPYARGTVSIATFEWTVAYPHPVHQYGLYDGTTPPTGGVIDPGTPIFVSGTQHLTVHDYLFYTGPAPTSGVAQPTQISGYFWDTDHTSASVLAHVAPIASLYPGWSVC